MHDIALAKTMTLCTINNPFITKNSEISRNAYSLLISPHQENEVK